MYKVQTNYCLILIKKLLDEIDWAHNFVQYVKQEFDQLLLYGKLCAIENGIKLSD